MEEPLHLVENHLLVTGQAHLFSRGRARWGLAPFEGN